MSTNERSFALGQNILRVVKRPLWLAVHAMTGRRMQVTTHFEELGCYGGRFEVESSPVGRRLPAGFEVAEHRSGFTELEIWCVQYRRIDLLRPYRELAIFAPVRFRRLGAAPLDGLYTLHMPVTTEEARWGGVDAYGFPKIVADIAITHEDHSTRCEVRHRGVHVLSLRIDARPTQSFEEKLTLLNVRDDARVVECELRMSGERGLADAPGGVSIELGPHAIAEDLRGLGARSEVGRGLYIPQAKMTLGKGVDLGPLPERASEAERVSGGYAPREASVR